MFIVNNTKKLIIDMSNNLYRTYTNNEVIHIGYTIPNIKIVLTAINYLLLGSLRMR